MKTNPEPPRISAHGILYYNICVCREGRGGQTQRAILSLTPTEVDHLLTTVPGGWSLPCTDAIIHKAGYRLLNTAYILLMQRVRTPAHPYLITPAPMHLCIPTPPSAEGPQSRALDNCGRTEVCPSTLEEFPLTAFLL